MKSKLEICGLSINVSVNTTTASARKMLKKSFNNVDATGRKLVQTYMRIDEQGQRVEVPKEDLVNRMKGFADPKTGMSPVVFSPADIKRLKAEAAERLKATVAARSPWVPLAEENSLRMDGFVPIGRVNNAAVKTVYYMAPDVIEGDEKVNYGLVHRAMVETGQAAFGMHLLKGTYNASYPAVVMPLEDGLLLFKMYFDDQFKKAAAGWAGVEEIVGHDKEVEALKDLIAEMEERDLPKWEDEATKQFNEALEGIKGGVTGAVGTPKAPGLSFQDRIRLAAERRRAMVPVDGAVDGKG